MEELKTVDIRTIAPETLVDVRTISINDNLSKEERAAEFARQVKKPYCFCVGDIIVKNVYSRNGILLPIQYKKSICIGLEISFQKEVTPFFKIKNKLLGLWELTCKPIFCFFLKNVLFSILPRLPIRRHKKNSLRKRGKRQ